MNHSDKFKSNGVAGPSGWTHVQLELYNQLVSERHYQRKSYSTGTIDHKGEMLARIGRIEMKVMAADKAGAEIFFVPDTIDADIAQYNLAAALTTMRHFVLLSKIKSKNEENRPCPKPSA